MASEARVVAEGVPHHLTQRGNNRQDVFLQDADRRLHLETMRTKAQDHALTVLGYCLMTNHVHLVVVPKRSTSLARAVGQAHRRYTAAFNRKSGRSGHLWQNRFYSCPLGPGHLVAAPAYVDLNPVRAGLVGEARQSPWSSAGAHTAAGAGDPLLDEWAWSELGLAENWEERMRRAGRVTAAFLAASQDLSKRWRGGWAGGCIRSRQDRARSPEPGAQARDAELSVPDLPSSLDRDRSSEGSGGDVDC